MRNSLLFVGTIATLSALACGSPSSAPERIATSSSPIQDGTTDSTHTFAVGVVQIQGQNAAFCSGALLAPNFVATARHCVAALASTQIDCATSAFGALVSASTMFVTTDAVISPSSSFIGVQSILVPTGSGQDKVCGNDIALLILSKNIQLSQYVLPVLSPPMTDHGAYSTSVVAIGYGIDAPTDTMGTSAGTRRIKEGIDLRCIPNDKSFTDCFSDPTAAQVMTAGEFISGDASTCEGDSGSSAYEQNNFAQGRWVSFGVLSRGGVSTDGQTCIQPIYTRFDAWSALLLDAANQAAAAGGYSAPSWATGQSPVSAAGGADAASGRGDGVTCSADSECLSSNCVSVDNGNFVCASPCTTGTCAPGFHCTSAFCFPDAAPAQTNKSGGCALAGTAEAPGSIPWWVIGLGVGLLAYGGLRRRGAA